MPDSTPQLRSLRAFFEERARAIGATPSLDDLSFVSGRDPRLWRSPGMYEDLVRSVDAQLALAPSHRLLEVGCAAGFLAQGLAPLVADYTGVDLSAAAVRRAEALHLPHAAFRVADGTALPFADASFDRALSYDVFTNFAAFDLAARVMREMLRVVRPGGRVLIGSLADAARRADYQARVREVSEALSRECGPVPPPRQATGLADRIRGWYERRVRGITPALEVYDFTREDFVAFGAREGVVTTILDIHPANPYLGLRFNVLLERPA